MTNLTPERLAEAREAIADSLAHGKSSETWYHHFVLALLDACDERDRLAAALARAQGPFTCCSHCEGDAIHDVETNAHEVPCTLCQSSIGEVERLRGERDRLAAQQLDPSRLSIVSGWLAVEVGHCNCGVSGGYFGAHERGCGLEDVLRLDTLPGWPVPRKVSGVMEHGDTPCLIGASHPAADPCEYPCPATMPGHYCTRLEHAEGGHLWATTEEERTRLLAELAESDPRAYLPITEDADGLTCDTCGAELADWAAADHHNDREHTP